MGTPIVAVLVVLTLLLLLALFARGGPTETLSGSLPAEVAGLSKLDLGELGSVTTRLFTELGFTSDAVHERPDRIDLTMTDPTPVTGQTLYIRCILPPAETGAVASNEVQAALDAARGENLSKAVVVTPSSRSPFSTSVTCTPSASKMPAYSQPMTPPPTTSIDVGIS